METLKNENLKTDLEDVKLEKEQINLKSRVAMINNKSLDKNWNSRKCPMTYDL